MPLSTDRTANLNNEPEQTWTAEQLRVIDARDKSLLVSAAAGSGKTAVLVQRILSMVTDPEHPIDVDELLVVTFTNAAAAEMRERILAALTGAAQQYPGDMHLQRQLSLIHNAQITTIDSFCLQVVTNHFHRIELEPGFRIADEGELTLLREEACDAVLEEFYAAKEPEFTRFEHAYSWPRSDKNIRDMIMQLYRYAQSYPWPDEWLDTCAQQYYADTLAELEQKEWVADYLAYLHQRTENLVTQCRMLIALSEDADGPKAYGEALRDDLGQLEALLACGGLSDWYLKLNEISWKNLARCKGESVNPEKKERVQAVRGKIKTQIKNMKERDFHSDPEEWVAVLKNTGEMVRMLVRLTKAFSERFSQEKAKKNILDFSDAEHFALRILEDPVTKEPTDIAAEYRKKFREVMIDEYQDSNYLQEEILGAVSGIPDGTQNMFMVGDVKQSIYRFRLARPDLFLSKYETFSKEEGPCQRIDLHKNFRSRGGILTIVNDLFGRIMGRDLGNVEYDAQVSLYQGRVTEEVGEDPLAGPFCPECILVETEKNKDNKMAEAAAIARRIRTMIEEEELPGIQYRDVVILLRTMRGWPSAFARAFEQEGVPLLVPSQTGYFDAQEVRVILAMLRTIDNPRQDIPLSTLMRSPIGNFSDEELSVIKASFSDEPFFNSVRRMALEESENTLHVKTARFWDMLMDFRERVPYTPIHTLIQQIYDETGYRDYATALPAGEQRRANLDMLLVKAADYEETSYHGLYHFVRYIDRIIKYEVDIGEAETVSEQENAVRLMTIHKSKGLEFPVVVVAGMGKQLNMTDVNSEMIFHQKYGVGLKYCDPDKRTKSDTLIRKAFSIDTLKESLGEELRVLYVAMTRAKDKLILAGTDPEIEKIAAAEAEPYQKLDFALRLDARTYWDWVLPALSTYGDTYPFLIAGAREEEESDDAHYRRISERKEALLFELANADREILEELNERFAWKYSYRLSGLKQKMSVSEIKHRAMAESRELSDEDEGEELFPDAVPVPYIPKFVKAREENEGALRGTAFHRLMECIDFAGLPVFPDQVAADRDETGHERSAPGKRNQMEMKDWLANQLKQLCESGRMEQEDADRIDPEQTCRFLSADLAARMSNAAKEGLLVREQPFVMSAPAGWFTSEAGEGESILIQGIIDAFWEEEGEIILLDYKTDHVNRPEELLGRYRAQLLLYADALRRRFPGKQVNRILIYSFCLDQLIPIDH